MASAAIVGHLSIFLLILLMGPLSGVPTPISGPNQTPAAKPDAYRLPHLIFSGDVQSTLPWTVRSCRSGQRGQSQSARVAEQP